MDVMLDPDKIKRYLDAFLPACIASARAQFEAGADAVMWADHTTGDLCRAETYRDFLLEMHQHITQEMGGPGIFHCCGKTIDRVHLFAAAGWDVFHFESQVDAREARAVAGERMALMGNLNNPTLLYQGTPEEVYKACWDLLDAGVDGLAPKGSVPLVTKKEPLHGHQPGRARLVRSSIAATASIVDPPGPVHEQLHRLPGQPEPDPTTTDRRDTSMADLKRLQMAVEVGDRETAVEVTQQAIDEEIPPKTVLDAMTDAMGVVGAALPGQGDLRPGDAHQRPRHEGRRGAAGAAAHRVRLQARQRRGHGHHQGRPPRHRQEPRRDDAQGRQLRDRRPGHQRVTSTSSWPPPASTRRTSSASAPC